LKPFSTGNDKVLVCTHARTQISVDKTLERILHAFVLPFVAQSTAWLTAAILKIAMTS